MDEVCICIVNYNNGPMTIQCIQSVFKQTFDHYKIIIIDNASTDRSVSKIRSFLQNSNYPFSEIAYSNQTFSRTDSFSKVMIIQADINGGYSFGNNVAIQYARKISAFTHLLIINNDVQLEDHFLEKMMTCFHHSQSCLKSDKIAMGATEFRISGKVNHRGYHHLNLFTGLSLSFPVFPSFKYIVGACIFLPMEAPLMDESFFLYYDDAQYSKILKASGYLLKTCSKAKYIHDISHTTRKEKSMHIHAFRSMKLFYRKHYPVYLPVVLIIRTIANLIMLRGRIAFDLVKIICLKKN
jgi:GT2 family glycosyltransferase